MKILLAQIEPRIGNLNYNFRLIEHYYNLATMNGCDICVFPELATVGYTPEDLLLDRKFILDLEAHIASLIKKVGRIALLLPTPLRLEDGLENAVLVIQNEKVIGKTSKQQIPNYDTFDERRYFKSGSPQVIEINGVKVGIPICEDLWDMKVCKYLHESGAQLLISPNASPFEEGKFARRLEILAQRYKEVELPIIYCNQLLAQDGLIYDGRSLVYDKGVLLATLKPFIEDYAIVEYANSHLSIQNAVGEYIEEDLLYGAIVFGLRQYVANNGFTKVILGLSGGIDSALVAAIAADAIGPENVRAIMLPFIYTSPESIEDAQNIAHSIGMKYESINIKPIVDAAMSAVTGISQLAYENLQARVRGMLLMTLSNTTNELLLTTGNKSENATGYATLYGDMCGGFNPIKDLYKTKVFSLAKFRNSSLPSSIEALNHRLNLIPQRVITKPPSAELRANQKDSDSLPEYGELDLILEGLIENGLSVEEITQKGFDIEKVEKVKKLLYRAEYKRRQSAPGVKVSRKAFDRDRRYPITLSV